MNMNHRVGAKNFSPLLKNEGGQEAEAMIYVLSNGGKERQQPDERKMPAKRIIKKAEAVR